MYKLALQDLSTYTWADTGLDEWELVREDISSSRPITYPVYINAFPKGFELSTLEDTFFSIAKIDVENKSIDFYPSRNLRRVDPLADPLAVVIINALSKIPDLAQYTIKEMDMSVSDLSAFITEEIATAPVPGSDDDPVFEEYKYLAIDTIQHKTFYHATKLSNLDSILEHGLVPSVDTHALLDKTQGEGWTQFNINLQNAVYLTSSIEYANDIALELALRHNESAVILSIPGSAIADPKKLVIDEDVLRDEYSGSIQYGYDVRMPAYMASLLNAIESVGYTDIIEPGKMDIYDIVSQKAAYPEEDS